jgi:hypothetical protein
LLADRQCARRRSQTSTHIPILLDYGHVDLACSFDSSPFAKGNLSCWHAMETYLHSLDASVPLVKECVP